MTDGKIQLRNSSLSWAMIPGAIGVAWSGDKLFSLEPPHWSPLAALFLLLSFGYLAALGWARMKGPFRWIGGAWGALRCGGAAPYEARNGSDSVRCTRGCEHAPSELEDAYQDAGRWSGTLTLAVMLGLGSLFVLPFFGVDEKLVERRMLPIGFAVYWLLAAWWEWRCFRALNPRR